MQLSFRELGGVKVGQLPPGVVISNMQDALDIIGSAAWEGAQAVLVPLLALPTRFFDLSNGFAGDFVQKAVNYRVRLLMIGPQSPDWSAAFRAFVVESNRGAHVAFAEDEAAATALLQR